MTKRQWISVCASAVLAFGCSHQPPAQPHFSLTVDSRGAHLFGPSSVHLGSSSVPLGRTCSNSSNDMALQLHIEQPANGFFGYSCYSSCFVGVGEGSIGKISSGESTTLDCHDESLQVVLHEV